LVIALAALIALAIPISLAIQLRVQVENGFSDFQGFYDAAAIIDSGSGERLYDRSLYDQPRLKDIMKVPGLTSAHYYIHAPFEALFFVPLARMPFAKAVWVWWSFSLICAFATLFVLLPYIPWIKQRLELGLVSAAIFVPIIATLFQGQDSLLTLLLFAICFASLSRGRYVLAGGALAITMYKPPLALPMILLLAITSRQRWRLLSGFFATFVLLVCAAIAALGWKCVAGYPALLSRFSTYEAGHWRLAEMPNVRGLAMLLLQHFLSEKLIFVIVATLSMVILAAAIWSVRKLNGRPEADPAVFSLFVTASVLVGFQEYTYDLALLYLPILLTWNLLYAQPQNIRDRKLMLYATMFLLLGSILSLTSPSLYACAIIIFFVLLIRQVCSASKLHLRVPQ
jgi:hypothetical protein